MIFDLWSLRIAQLGDRIASEDQDLESQPQSQVFSTLDTDESGTDNERSAISTPKGRDKKLNSAPNLYDCLALCYLGTYTLRLPITPGDIFTWTTDGKMPYRRAIAVVPLAMRDRLPPSYHAILDPPKLLRHSRFYSTLTNLEISYEKVHGILWPPLNVPLLLFRYIKELALPLELYDITLRLANLLGHSFALEYDGRKRLGLRHLPEAQLIGCFIVCVKLFYPFDKIRRLPKSSSEPTVSVVDWKTWCKQMTKARKRKQGLMSDFTNEEFTQLQEEDIFHLLPKQLDQYLDFYNDTFIDDAEIQRTQNNNDFKNALFDMFPIANEGREPTVQPAYKSAHEVRLETVRSVHSSMKTRAVIRDEQQENVLRPGQSYPIWRTAEDVPDRAAVFYEEAARLAGFSMDMLATSVFATECRIERWRSTQRNREGSESLE